MLLPSGITAADEELVKSIKFRSKAGPGANGILKALPDSDDDEQEPSDAARAAAGTGSGSGSLAAQVLHAVAAKSAESDVAPPPPVLIKKKAKRADDGNAPKDGAKKQKTAATVTASAAAAVPSGLGNLMAYGSDDD